MEKLEKLKLIELIELYKIADGMDRDIIEEVIHKRTGTNIWFPEPIESIIADYSPSKLTRILTNILLVIVGLWLVFWLFQQIGMVIFFK